MVHLLFTNASSQIAFLAPRLAVARALRPAMSSTSEATTLEYQAEVEHGPPDLAQWMEEAVDNPDAGIGWTPMNGWWQDEVPSDAEAGSSFRFSS